MLAKILLTILGAIGLATIVTHSPAPTNSTAQKPAAVIVTQPTNTVADKTGDFAKVKSPATTSPSKVQPKKPAAAKTPAKPPTKVVPVTETPKAAGAAAAPAATSSLAVSGNVSVSSTPTINFDAINQTARKAIVNILCTSKTGGSFEPLSASGVMIDPRGIILTNAHVAEYFLLKDYGQKDFLSCIGRAGSPAVPVYTLNLLYISPQWVKENYKMITDQKPTGTGENDFALLTVASSTNPDVNLPASFPYLIADSSEDGVITGTTAVLASYPAGFLGGIAIQRDLYLASTVVNIGKLYTFGSGSLDIFSLGGSPVAQHGSSGGAAVGTDGKLLGIIVTSTDAADTSARDLDAISIAHINRSLFAETGMTLDGLLSSDLSAFGSAWNAQVLPDLKKLLFNWIDSKNRR